MFSLISPASEREWSNRWRGAEWWWYWGVEIFDWSNIVGGFLTHISSNAISICNDVSTRCFFKKLSGTAVHSENWRSKDIFILRLSFSPCAHLVILASLYKSVIGSVHTKSRQKDKQREREREKESESEWDRDREWIILTSPTTLTGSRWLVASHYFYLFVILSHDNLFNYRWQVLADNIVDADFTHLSLMTSTAVQHPC